MNYLKKYKVFEGVSIDNRDAIKRTIATIRKITNFMEEDVKKACESMGVWNMDTLKFSFSGFNNSGSDGEWNFEEYSDDEMMEDVIKYEFPLMDDKTETGFSINIELSNEYYEKNNLVISHLDRDRLMYHHSAKSMYLSNYRANKNAGGPNAPFKYVDLDTETATLHFSFLNLNAGKQLRDILNKKYVVEDVEEDKGGIWMSIAFNLKDYFDRSKNLFSDINR